MMAEDFSRVSLSVADYAVLGVTLLISLSIGCFFALTGGRQRSQGEYLLAGGTLSFWPVCLSLFATYQSAIGLLGVPADTYLYGAMVVYQGVGVAIANSVTAFTIVPLFHPLHLTSVYEYLELRYESTVVRLIGVIVGMAWTVIYMGIALLSPALAIQGVTDVPLWASVVVVAIIGTVYTTIGGIKSVVWTDVFQTIVILVGLVAIMVKGTLEVGSTAEVMDTARLGDRNVFGDVSADPRVRHTLWGFIVGYTWYWMSVNLNQSSIQRISSTRSLKHARLVFLAALPINLSYGVALVFCGLIIYAYFVHTGCDPLEKEYVTNANQLTIYFVVKVLGFLPGVSGLYLATVLSGSLSTLSSGLNSLAANTVEDFLRRPLSKMTSSRVTTITKCIVLLYGCLIMGLAYLMRSLQGPVSQITATSLGACGGPVFGLFFLGAVFPQANKYGAIVGTVSAMVISVWVSLGGFLYGTKTPTKPPGPTYNCPTWNNTHLESQDVVTYSSSSSSSSVLETAYFSNATIAYPSAQVDGDEHEFFLYDLSYLWYTMLSSCIAVIIGLIVSLIANVITAHRPPPSHLLLPQIRRLCGNRLRREYDVTTEKQQSERELGHFSHLVPSGITQETVVASPSNAKA